MRRLYRWFCTVEQTIAMIALLASTFLIFLSSIMRYLGVPLNWSLEISMFIFAWCVFLSADVALRENRMVNLDLFVKRLPPKGQLCLSILCYLIILVFLGVMTWYGFDLTWRTRVRMFHGIDFSYAWVTLSLPVASIFMAVTACIKLYGFVVGLVSPGAVPPPDDGGEAAQRNVM